MENKERLINMNINELREELQALYSERRGITNNYSGWSHPDTQRHANKVFKELTNQIDFINRRLDKLGYFDGKE